MWHYLSRPLDAYTVEITEIAAACNEVHIYYTSSGSRVSLKQSAFVPGASGTVLETLMVEAGTSSNRRVAARNLLQSWGVDLKTVGCILLVEPLRLLRAPRLASGVQKGGVAPPPSPVVV